MGRKRITQAAFSNGVLSPRVLGRVDLEKYKHSAESIVNMIVTPQGALKKRAGSQNVAPAMGPSRLIPFVFAPGQAYILELGNQLIRFYYAENTTGKWTQGHQIMANGLPFQLVTPYDTSSISLWDIQYAQQGDVMYFFHPGYPVQKLLRFGTVGLVPGPTDTNWRWIPVTFACPPTDQFDQDISNQTISITPGTNGSGQDATTPGAQSIPFTASAAGTWIDGDVGKMIIVGTAVAQITSTTATDNTGTVALATILVPFLNTNTISPGNWLMRGAPNGWANFGRTNAGNWISTAQYGVGLIEQLVTFTEFPINGSPPVPTQDCFRPIDLGRILNVSGCMAVITSVDSAHQVHAQYLSVPEDTFVGSVAGEIRVSPAAPGAWGMEDPIWLGLNNGILGTTGQAAIATPCYPAVGGFFQNRLYLGATAFQPKTLWGSQSDNYENFAKGTLAGDGLEFSLAGGKLDTIRWIAGTPVQGLLAIETDATEYVASGGSSGGGSGQGITPTNIFVQANSAQGGSGIVPVLVDAALLYIQRYHTKVFEFSYNIYQSSFSSRDLSLFAEHLTHAGIKEVAYQPIPYKIIWMVTFDGRLLGMTYDKNQDVLAWHEHRTGYADQGYGPVGTGDSYISVAAIPNPSPVLTSAQGIPVYGGNASATYACDLVWTVVKRGNNYYVELMNEDLLVDCSSAAPQSAPLSTTQLRDSNLGGRVVVGYGMPLNAVKSYFPYDTPFGLAATADAFGTITTEIKVGTVTGYGLPFQCKVLTIRPEIPEAGSIISVNQGWHDVFFRVWASRTITVNGDVLVNHEGFEAAGVSVPADSLEPGNLLQGQNLDQTWVANPQQTMSDEVTPETVDLRTSALGMDRFGRILITMDQPYPLTLLAFSGILTYGEA